MHWIEQEFVQRLFSFRTKDLLSTLKQQDQRTSEFFSPSFDSNIWSSIERKRIFLEQQLTIEWNSNVFNQNSLRLFDLSFKLHFQHCLMKERLHKQMNDFEESSFQLFFTSLNIYFSLCQQSNNNISKESIRSIFDSNILRFSKKI